MRVLVCGDRDWDEPRVILARLAELPLGAVVIHGACSGADTAGGQIADALGFEVEPYPAHWRHTEDCSPGCSEYVGPGAGPIRNRKMLRESRPDLVLAFHANIEHSKGTKHMVSIAREAGVPVEIITGM